MSSMGNAQEKKGWCVGAVQCLPGCQVTEGYINVGVFFFFLKRGVY
jgi:hypothetical protein